MARDVRNEKLESLRRCVLRVEERRAESVEQLEGDPDRQDILALNLTRAVQICVDLAVHVVSRTHQAVPSTMGEAFTELASLGVIDDDLAARMRAAVGFRNVAVHAYEQLDWAIVHAVSHEGLNDVRRFARAIDAHLRDATS
mgnify:CR=1 FL=1